MLSFSFLVDVDNIALAGIKMPRRRAAARNVAKWVEAQQESPQHYAFVRYMKAGGGTVFRDAPDPNRVVESAVLGLLQICELAMFAAVPICI